MLEGETKVVCWFSGAPHSKHFVFVSVRDGHSGQREREGPAILGGPSGLAPEMWLI